MFEELRESLKEKFGYWEQDIEDADVMDFAEYDLAKAIDRSDGFKLYRYMPAEYFNIRNIETQTIHLSVNGVMNDIYEGMPNMEGNLPYYKVQKLKDLAMMSCLSETNNNNLMWSHYADEHKGFCVEYDLKRLSEDRFDIIKHLFPVIYGSKRLIKKDIDSLIGSHMELNKAIEERIFYEGKETLDDILPLFLTKGSVWEYEQEWRIIYTKKQMYDIDEDELYNGNLKFKCISAIYLGYRIHPEIKANVLEICGRISTNDKPVEVFQTKLDSYGYDITFDRIF